MKFVVLLTINHFKKIWNLLWIILWLLFGQQICVKRLELVSPWLTQRELEQWATTVWLIWNASNRFYFWACPTPTKSNCWCRLRTAGGVPTPHGSAVKSKCFFLFLLHILYRALLLQCCICFIFKPQHCSLGVIVYLYWIFHINEISIVLDVKKKKNSYNHVSNECHVLCTPAQHSNYDFQNRSYFQNSICVRHDKQDE